MRAAPVIHLDPKRGRRVDGQVERFLLEDAERTSRRSRRRRVDTRASFVPCSMRDPLTRHYNGPQAGPSSFGSSGGRVRRDALRSRGTDISVRWNGASGRRLRGGQEDGFSGPSVMRSRPNTSRSPLNLSGLHLVSLRSGIAAARHPGPQTRRSRRPSLDPTRCPMNAHHDDDTASFRGDVQAPQGVS